ncbi:MAG: histidine phosphatase family protein [Actinomycetota bacterium]
MDPTRLILVRHGESNVTVEGRFGGEQACTGLSPLGRQQAERLRDRFAAGQEPAVDEVWSSQLPRAYETAEIVNAAIGHPVQIDPGLEEFRPGAVDGMRFADYVEQYGRPDQLADPYRYVAEGGDSRASFFLRIGETFDHLLSERSGRSIAVFCHGGVVDAVFRQLLGIAGEAPFQLHTANTAITEFVTTDHGPPRRWRLVRYNDSAHLAGLPAATPPAPSTPASDEGD